MDGTIEQITISTRNNKFDRVTFCIINNSKQFCLLKFPYNHLLKDLLLIMFRLLNLLIKL